MRRSYMFVYGLAQDTMLRTLERLNADGRRTLLQELYAGPVTHRAFLARAVALSA